mmetsp:Transcript_46321/g.104607  ORF Transcript_46321/g.104607 Transcript_46321/m.104607 type:complete len:230 (-) Transcript_46321:371-1060(-)
MATKIPSPLLLLGLEHVHEPLHGARGRLPPEMGRPRPLGEQADLGVPPHERGAVGLQQGAVRRRGARLAHAERLHEQQQFKRQGEEVLERGRGILGPLAPEPPLRDKLLVQPSRRRRRPGRGACKEVEDAPRPEEVALPRVALGGPPLDQGGVLLGLVRARVVLRRLPIPPGRRQVGRPRAVQRQQRPWRRRRRGLRGSLGGREFEGRARHEEFLARGVGGIGGVGGAG